MTDKQKDDFDTLARWDQVTKELTKLKKEEMALRKQLFATFFPEADLGVNNYSLNAQWVLKGTAKVSKTVDVALLANTIPKLTEGVEDHVINYKPSIDYKAFEYLNDYDKALLSECIVTKPATPTLALVESKR